MDRELLLRSKLHFRGGNIRRAKGEISDAVASYYDAFSSAMKHLFLSNDKVECYALPKLLDIEDDETLFIELSGAGVIDESFTLDDFYRFDRLLQASFNGNPSNEDFEYVIDKLEKLLTHVGVLPITPNELPTTESITI